MKSKLIVPMLIEAYVSAERNPEDKKVPIVTPNYKDVYGKSILGQKNTPGCKQVDDPLETGLHLHFIMPDAFTYSASPDSGYPAVPDRYIVTRLWKDRFSSKLNSKCWVIESNFISQDAAYAKSVTIPYSTAETSRMNWRYLGRCYSADNPPPEAGKELDKLTAIGAGDILFNAYYPNCKSVFGFHDDLKDLQYYDTTNLVYFVVGYFSKSKNDPFANIKSADEFSKLLEAYRFSVAGSPEICDGSLFYGSACSIEWKGYNDDYCSTPSGKVHLAFGNTSAEALSAAIKNISCTFSKTDGINERMLTALQYELFDEAEKPDGNFLIDDEIHFRTFSSTDGFDEARSLVVDADITASSEVNESAEIGGRYSALLALGSEIGALKREILYEKTKLYCVWEQYVLLYEEGGSSKTRPTKSNLLAEMKDLCSNLDKLTESLKELVKKYDAKLKTFGDSLPAGIDCKKGAAAPFYTAKDPVLLLCGDGINRSFAFGENGRFTSDGTLFCQLDPVASSVKDFDTCFTDISYIQNIQSIPEDYKNLLLQTVLICPELLSVIKTLLGTDASAVSGDSPSPLAVNTKVFDWTTLCMIWSATYYPTCTPGNSDNPGAHLDGWAFEYGDTNLVYKGRLTPDRLKAYNVSGRMILTPHAVKLFAASINRYCEEKGEDEMLKMLAEKIRYLPVISQNLSGFSDSLSGFIEALQFPIVPIENNTSDLIHRVREHLGDERRSASPYADLLPMRGGFVKISSLKLVSSFGQTQPLAFDSYYNSGEIVFAETVRSDIKEYGLLPPCFNVPSRLSANFVSALNDSVVSSSAYETSPVCGILIPEMLNRRMLAYSADGVYLGMLKTVYRNGQPEARWISAPRDGGSYTDLHVDNPYFFQFLDHLLNIKNAFFDFNTLTDIYLDNKQCLDSLIWGRPLVLSRLKLKFDFYGRPEFSKSFEDFKKYDTYNAEKIRFPVKFGDIERISDGLLACFRDDDFTALYPPFGYIPDKNSGYIVSDQELTLSFEDGEKYFTVLTAPNLSFHIQTGILPALKVQIDGEHTGALSKLALFAECSSVLGSPDEPALPQIHADDNSLFKWYRLNGTVYSEHKIVPPMVSFDDTILMDGALLKE